MPRWLPRLLRHIHELAGRGRVRLTLKAVRELATIAAGLDHEDEGEGDDGPSQRGHAAGRGPPRAGR